MIWCRNLLPLVGILAVAQAQSGNGTVTSSTSSTSSSDSYDSTSASLTSTDSASTSASAAIQPAIVQGGPQKYSSSSACVPTTVTHVSTTWAPATTITKIWTDTVTETCTVTEISTYKTTISWVESRLAWILLANISPVPLRLRPRR